MVCVFVFVFACLIPAIKCQDYNTQQLQSYNNLNGPCNTAKDCRPFGYVCRHNKTCECERMYIPDFYKIHCVGGVDQKCTYDEHCIPGAFCMNQAICKCKESTPIVLENGMVCARSNTISKLKNYIYVSVLPIIIYF